MKKKPTIKTIAEIAGVSHVAVSKALRDCTDISPETTKRIKAIAKEIGYTPNAYARNLSLTKTDTIGMIVPSMGSDTVYNDIFNAISFAAAMQDFNVILGSCNRDINLEKKFCKSMCENRVGAIIVSPISSNVDHIKEICRDNVPLIFIGGKIGLEQKNCITVDYKYSAQLAVDYLHSLGHTNIALFLYHSDNNTIKQKRNGYLEAMEKLNLEPKIYWHGDSTDTFHSGTEIIEKLILLNQLPTAIWCANDIMALGVISALQKHRFKVPEDISVIGHDNLFFTELDSIALSTFSLPKKEIGEKAVEIAIKLMDDTNPTSFKSVFRADIVKRKTTGKNKR